MCGAGDAVHLAHDHGAPRSRRLIDRRQRPRAVADRRRLLRVGADDEAGIVDEVHDGKIFEHRVDPRDHGLTFCELHEVRGGDRSENARILLGILEGTERGPKRDLVLLNAAAGLVITSLAPDLAAGLELAREQINSGQARARLDALRRAG